MKNKHYKNDGAFELTKEIWTDISIKENKTFNKKERSRSCHNSKRIRIKIIISNIYETREITVYKELSRRLTS